MTKGAQSYSKSRWNRGKSQEDLMEVGIDVGIYGALATPVNVIGLAQFAESRNYHSIWLADHIVFPAKVGSRYP